MLNKKSILIVTWTRAEYGLLKSLILWLKKSDNYNVQLLVTWMHLLQKYLHTIDNIKKDNIKIDFEVKVSEDWDMLTWLSEEIKWINEIFKNNNFDLVFILWDRDEPLAAAIVAAHYKIPVAHIHWWDIVWHLPDEYIRSAITKFSHLHFTASEKSYQRVLNMWENKKNIFNVWAIWLDWIDKNKLLSKKELSKLFWFDYSKKWILLLQHPTIEEIDYSLQIKNSLNVLEKIDAEKIIIYPNSDTWNEIFIENIEKYSDKKWFYIFKNIDREKYLSLLNNIDVLIWNSSSWIIESWFFWLKVLNIWNRQKWREKWKNIIDSNYNKEDILSKLNILLENKKKVIDSTYYKWWTVNNIIKVLDKIKNFNILFNEK